MKFGLGIFLFGAALYAQSTCASQDPLQIVDSVQGTVDQASCKLSDGSSYAQYRMVVPVRGTLQLDAASTDFPATVFVRTPGGHLVASGAGINQYIESGDYFVVVNAANAGQSGNFTLKTNFTPEPAVVCDNSRSLNVDQKITANLTAASCKLLDGTPYDEYVIYAHGKGNLDIQVDTSDFTPTVILQDAYGQKIATDPNHISQTLDADSSYYILVSGATADATGKYNLTLAFTPDSKETCIPKKVFSSTDTLSTQMDNGSCVYTDPSSGDSYLYDFYNFDVPDTGLAEFKVVTTSVGAQLYLYDPSYNLIAFDYFGAANDTGVIRRFLKPGRYILEVFAGDDRVGPYQFTYTYRAGNPQSCPSASFQSGGSAAGTVAANTSCPVGASFGDLYSVTLPSSGTLQAKMNSNEIYTSMQIFDAKDNLLTDDGNSGGEAVSNISADLPAGNYTIAASSQYGSGAYNVSYQFAAKDIPACTSPIPLKVETSLSGDLTKSTCRDAGGQPYDLYEFTTTQDGTIEVSMQSSSTVAPLLTLEDQQGKILRRDNDSIGFGFALLLQYLPAGTYRLGAHNASATPAGTYDMDFFFNAGARPAGCTPLSTIKPGDTVQGVLDFTSCRWDSYYLVDIYKVEIPEDGSYDLVQNSRQVDAFIYLLDDKGNVIDMDDNSGGRTNAKLTETLKAGTYYLLPSSYDLTETGSYTVAVTKH